MKFFMKNFLTPGDGESIICLEVAIDADARPTKAASFPEPPRQPRRRCDPRQSSAVGQPRSIASPGIVDASFYVRATARADRAGGYRLGIRQIITPGVEPATVARAGAPDRGHRPVSSRQSSG